LAPLSFMPNWLSWLASINPLTFAIEPIRASYSNNFELTDIVLNAPYGSLNSLTCIAVLASLALFLFIAIRPLLDRRLN
jgi:ABC-2 type transport system permease protein